MHQQKSKKINKHQYTFGTLNNILYIINKYLGFEKKYAMGVAYDQRAPYSTTPIVAQYIKEK